jgi:hypothetical protein
LVAAFLQPRTAEVVKVEVARAAVARPLMAAVEGTTAVVCRAEDVETLEAPSAPEPHPASSSDEI